MPIPTPISYGSEITTDSVATDSVARRTPQHLRWQSLALLIVSRDGSRRILNVGQGRARQYHSVASLRDETAALKPTWRLSALGGLPSRRAVHAARDWSASTPLESGRTYSRAAPEGKRMVGLYVPYYAAATAVDRRQDSQSEPVNHIPLIHTLRSELSSIAAGWDIFWHSRFVFANHVRQQVVSRLVDGILAYGWAEIAKVEAAARPGVNPAWKMETVLTADVVRMAVGPITGDPALWARRMARNIDVEAFRLRLAKGEIPGVDTRAMPWGPTAETLISTTPTGDVNEKNVAIVEWHEANQVNTEGKILPYHDDELQRPVEQSFGFEYEHEHDLTP